MPARLSSLAERRVSPLVRLRPERPPTRPGSGMAEVGGITQAHAILQKSMLTTGRMEETKTVPAMETRERDTSARKLESHEPMKVLVNDVEVAEEKTGRGEDPP